MKKKFYKILTFLRIYKCKDETDSSLTYEMIRWNPLSWIYIILVSCFKFILYLIYGSISVVVNLIKEFIKPNKIIIEK